MNIEALECQLPQLSETLEELAIDTFNNNYQLRIPHLPNLKTFVVKNCIEGDVNLNLDLVPKLETINFEDRKNFHVYYSKIHENITCLGVCNAAFVVKSHMFPKLQILSCEFDISGDFDKIETLEHVDFKSCSRWERININNFVTFHAPEIGLDKITFGGIPRKLEHLCLETFRGSITKDKFPNLKKITIMKIEDRITVDHNNLVEINIKGNAGEKTYLNILNGKSLKAIDVKVSVLSFDEVLGDLRELEWISGKVDKIEYINLDDAPNLEKLKVDVNVKILGASKMLKELTLGRVSEELDLRGFEGLEKVCVTECVLADIYLGDGVAEFGFGDCVIGGDDDGCSGYGVHDVIDNDDHYEYYESGKKYVNIGMNGKAVIYYCKRGFKWNKKVVGGMNMMVR